jgi:superfamily II DNA or RNA helicase
LTSGASKLKKPVITLVTPQLLNRFLKNLNKYDLNPMDVVRAVVLDEVHHTYWGPEIGESIRSVLSLENIKFALGLSATPTKEAEQSLGGIIYSCPTKKAMNSGILVSDLKIYSTRTEVRNIRIEEQTFKWIPNEWNVAIYERAEEYAEKILKVLEKEALQPLSHRIPKTLVVAANVKEADEIKRRLYEQIKSKCNRQPDNLVFIAHYGVGRGKATRVIRNFKQKKEGILITVNMADMGFDDKNLEVLTIARPVSSPTGYVQIRGRVLRKPDQKTADENNIKLQKEYAVMIDFTEASRHEEEAEDVEEARLLEECQSLKKDLEGYGEGVAIAHGEVSIEDFKVKNIMEKKQPGTQASEKQNLCPLCKSESYTSLEKVEKKISFKDIEMERQGVCPECKSNVSMRLDSFTNRELIMSGECPRCKTCFKERYEKKGSFFVLVNKEKEKDSSARTAC